MSEGSSPRMRGARHVDMRGAGVSGIIPADAGSTETTAWALPASKDHPRGCGEHMSSENDDLPYSGSSPRMRGARMAAAWFWMATRIIPADAGSTCRMLLSTMCPMRIIPADAGSTTRRPRSSSRQPDHPRGCGEHSERLEDHLNEPGSSPRMRGARWHPHSWASRSRIIPADAGSTKQPLDPLPMR